ncbi:hypothetical protein ACK16A_29090 [Klebsiella michiganensis]|uniref:hypothetical protein n=1 Tax=Klebsiella TaxID=570 RepID=UPI0011503643|nr:hypothetical protein [Klebsiella pneumoniae]MCP5658037.1 hypothetical protein [Klebsiella pneumoniae]
MANVITVSLPEGWESWLLGAPYIVSQDSVLTITINSAKVPDDGRGLAIVNYSLAVDTDQNISLSRTDEFAYSDPSALESEAENYLKSLFGG